MSVRILFFTLSILLTFSFSTAQAQTIENQGVYLSPTGKKIKRNVTTVIFSSLAGGVLGLSTLSFYGQPQEHTVNITTGILLGFISGVSYVIYSNSEFKNNNQIKERTFEPIEDAAFKNKKPAPSPLVFTYAWNF